jgi:DNA-binding CsgD family transcriptional regulator
MARQPDQVVPAAVLRGITSGGIDSLSRRESEVLGLAAAGYLDKEICRELGVSPNTLRTYWSRIRIKVGDVPRSALAVAYVQASSSEALPDISGVDWEVDLDRWTYRSLKPGSPVAHVTLGSEVPYDDVLAQVHPDDAKSILKFFEDLKFNGLESYSHSVRMVTPTGIETTNSLVRVQRDEVGKAVLLRGTRSPSVHFGSAPPGRVEVGYWERDIRSGAFTADEGFCEIFGLDPADPNLRDSALARFHPEEKELTRTFVDKAVASGKSRSRATHRLRQIGDTYRWITTDLRIEYEDGVATRALGTVMAFDPD